MSPKSLLRHPGAVSSFSALTTGSFHKIIVDEAVVKEEVQRILLCTGKIYYDLLHGRQERKLTNVAIVRVEQLYPLPEDTLLAALQHYPEDIPLIWVQEEPLNMGAYPFIYLKFGNILGRYWRFTRVGRPESATPATGSAASHKLEQMRLIEEAFTSEGHA
jgi:2-oxoglutarate dehydrogenase E1 component